jgi:hypothetical protein
VEERLKEQEAEGIEMPTGMERDELALRILVAAELSRVLHRPSKQGVKNRGIDRQ